MGKLCIASLVIILASNTAAGFCARATLAMLPLSLGAISDQSFERFAIRAHIVELPAPFGMEN